jgi:homoaconitate hydratase
MGQTVVEKIAQSHAVDRGSQRPARAGDFLEIRPKHVMTHDNTAAVMKKFQTLGASRMDDPGQPVYALDHDIQNKTPENLAKYEAIESFAKSMGVDFYPAGTGIGHQILVEHGYVVPGSFVVASDSHSNMYGALGAIGTPVVRTDAAAIWATGVFWWQIPRTVSVALEGQLAEGVTGKDVILTLCGLYPSEVLNAAVEFTGPGVRSLSMDARLTISNMTTEWGALVGWFPVDDVTISYLHERREILGEAGGERLSEAAIEGWTKNPPAPDPDANYAARIVLDLGEVTPHIAGPDTVQATAPLAELKRERVRIDKAYLLSCVNSRYEDLAAAADVLRGKEVAGGVDLYVAAASAEIQARAEKDGIWQVFVDAGAHLLPPSCGPCIGLGTGLLEPDEVGISATNRNFKGRMGSRDARCYLASPEVVAASAVAGVITGPDIGQDRLPTKSYEVLATSAPAGEETEILEGFPETMRGRVLLVPADNLNTDGIYGKDYTYREGMTREEMAAVVMENYDPDFARTAQEGDVVVAGWNFGTGSSREQAVTALAAKGIRMVIAASFSQTYLRNAFNNGFLCLECPELVSHLREVHSAEIAGGSRTIALSEDLEVDFRSGTLRLGKTFRFAPLGPVPQSLVAAGGVENLVRAKLSTL